MGASVKKRDEKRREFQKPKLKVGKAKAKATNFTDLSFKSKAILVGEQYRHSSDTEGIAHTFKRHLALASTARSEKQRHASLTFLTDQLANTSLEKFAGTHSILTKVLPLILDSSTHVRRQLIDLLRCLPSREVAADVERVLVFVRAGMTHLSADIGADTLAVMNWLLDVAPEATVGCPGSWVKTLNNFCVVLGWSTPGDGGWSSAPLKGGFRAQDTALLAVHLTTLSRFLNAGLNAETMIPRLSESKGCIWPGFLFAMRSELMPLEHVNVFWTNRDEDCAICTNRETRQRVFLKRFMGAVEVGIEIVKKEGGVLGRTAVALQQTIQQSMLDFGHSEMADGHEPIVLW